MEAMRGFCHGAIVRRDASRGDDSAADGITAAARAPSANFIRAR